ncbi:MAG: carboxypeptidase regulatory-like domain-containing protein [Elusimicrobiota bacterium]
MSRFSVLLAAGFLALSGCKKGGSEQAAAPTEAAPVEQAVQNPVDSATAATVSGSVKFTGAKPKSQKLAMGADAYCKTKHTTDVLSEEVTVNANNTLKNVVIYVKSGLDANLKFPTPTTPVILDQIGCLYVPHAVALQAGQELLVRNSDGVLHNVNARPTKNQGFNFGQPVQGMENKKTFSEIETGIPVKCDVHPWMHGTISVFNHPYFSITGEDGSFSLANLPPGEYEIEAWHEKYGTSVQKVTVGASETKSITFTFKGA